MEEDYEKWKTKKTNENNNEIETLSKNLCMHIAASDPKSLNIESLDTFLIDKERSIYKEQLIFFVKPI